MENILEVNKYKIFDASPDDVQSIRLITRDAWLSIYANDKINISREDIAAIDWLNPEQLAKRKKRIEKDQNAHTWVLKSNDGRVVGFCQVTKNISQSAMDTQKEIEAMYIIPELQGKGLGKKLMEKALSWLGPDQDIKLEVVSYNFQAINFYKKFGFIETSYPVSDKRTQLPSGKQIPRIVMIRSKNS